MITREAIDMQLIEAMKSATVSGDGQRTYTIGTTTITTCGAYMVISTMYSMHEFVYASMHSFMVITDVEEPDVVRIRYNMDMVDGIMAHGYMILSKEVITC